MHYKRYYAILTVFAKILIFTFFLFFFSIRMSEKRGKKKPIKNNKKVSKDKKTITVRLNNGAEIPAKNIYKEDSTVFKINDIDIDKVIVSDKKLYNKEHVSYKYYVFYEDGNECILLKITLLDVHGYYNTFKVNSKIMNFNLHDNSLEQIIDIFDHIGKILNIDIDNYIYEDKMGITYLKTKVSDKTCFRKDKDKTLNTIPNEKTKHNCRVLLQIQYVYYDNNEDANYYPQVFLQICRYTFIANNKLIHDVLEFTDTELESESEEKFNENTELRHENYILINE